MATLDEVYAKVVSDDAEKQTFIEALTTEEGTAAYLAQHGCEASPAELISFLKEKVGTTGEVADGDLEGAGGGKALDWTISLTSLGFGCAIAAVVSALDDYGGSHEYITIC